MRDKNRIKPFLDRLEKVWNKVPDWRFGQLISNVFVSMDRDPFFPEDDEMIQYFEKYFEGRKRMRILKEVNEEKVHKCRYCKSLYTYIAKDVDYTWYNHIKCPVCKSIDSTSIFDKKVKN